MPAASGEDNMPPTEKTDLPVPISRTRPHAPLRPSPLNPAPPCWPSPPPRDGHATTIHKKKHKQRHLLGPSLAQRLLRQKVADAFRSETIELVPIQPEPQGGCSDNTACTHQGATDRERCLQWQRLMPKTLSNLTSERDGLSGNVDQHTLKKPAGHKPLASRSPVSQKKHRQQKNRERIKLETLRVSGLVASSISHDHSDGERRSDTGCFHAVDPAPVQSHLFATTEPGAIVAFPIRRRPDIAAVKLVLVLLALTCVVGLVRCMQWSFWW